MNSKYPARISCIRFSSACVALAVLVLCTLGAVHGREGQTKILFLIEEHGKWGYIDEMGRVRVAPAFSQAQPFSEGLAFVGQGGRNFFINSAGKPVGAQALEDAGPYSEGLAMFEQGGKQGYIDRDGRVVISATYDNASPFSEGRAAVTRGGLFAFIDRNGKAVYEKRLGPEDSDTDWVPFREGLAFVQDGKDYLCIDRAGQVIFRVPFPVLNSYSEGLALVQTATGQRTLEVGQDKIPLGIIPTSYGYINKRGALVLPGSYSSARSFSEGVAAVRLGHKWIYIDRSGKECIATSYDDAQPFSCGLAKVSVGRGQNALSGYIDRKGVVAIRIQYPQADNFKEGLAAVVLGGKKAYINTAGETVWRQP